MLYAYYERSNCLIVATPIRHIAKEPFCPEIRFSVLHNFSCTLEQHSCYFMTSPRIHKFTRNADAAAWGASVLVSCPANHNFIYMICAREPHFIHKMSERELDPSRYFSILSHFSYCFKQNLCSNNEIYFQRSSDILF